MSNWHDVWASAEFISLQNILISCYCKYVHNSKVLGSLIKLILECSSLKYAVLIVSTFILYTLDIIRFLIFKFY